MTIRFQGSYKDKRRITYKAEGDGSQCDVLCQEGYCYQHYFRNDPRVMWLFDSLRDYHHQIGMDNPYNSTAFCCAYLHSMQVLCHVVDYLSMVSVVLEWVVVEKRVYTHPEIGLRPQF